MQKNELVSVIDAEKNQLTLEASQGALAEARTRHQVAYRRPAEADGCAGAGEAEQAELIMNQAKQKIERRSSPDGRARRH